MNWSTMKTMTRWGDREVARWIFTNTPFGEVELLNFQKSGPSEFTIWLDVVELPSERCRRNFRH
jgi:hypothetical protein